MKPFGKLRNLLWPIHRFELLKFLPMFAMFFCISINYSILRIMKDSLIINAPGAGAESLPFLKLWCTTPAAFLFMIFYLKASSMVPKRYLFYLALAPFFIFFTLFPTVIYPSIAYLHPVASANWLQMILPDGFSGLIALYRNWTLSLFYVLAELWGSVMLSTVFWGFANEITKVEEAKRFYGLLLLGANFALIFVAPITKYANQIGNWDDTLRFIMGISVTCCILVALCYWFITNQVLTRPEFAVAEPVTKKKKAKMNFFKGLKQLGKNPYLMFLALIVLSYGITINLVEVIWKHNLKILFAGNKKDFLDFQGLIMTSTGLATMFLLFFGTSNILRRFSWGTVALITPIVLLISSSIFFANISFGHYLQGVFVTVGLTPLLAIAYVGGFQNVFSKSCKYSFFDPTKEMAYIPLDDDTKRMGKAAIDGVGARLGKSGGAAINMVLIAVLGSIDAITPVVAVISIGTIGVWIYSVGELNKRFKDLTENTEEERDEETVSVG